MIKSRNSKMFAACSNGKDRSEKPNRTHKKSLNKLSSNAVKSYDIDKTKLKSSRFSKLSSMLDLDEQDKASIEQLRSSKNFVEKLKKTKNKKLIKFIK